MKTVKQLSLFLENKPGTLAAVCKTLAAERINVLAISVSDAVDHAVVRMVVDDARKALHLLGERGVLVIERDVLMINCRNRPGELAAIARKLAAAKINIEYAYAAAIPEADAGAIVLRVDKPAAARRILKGY
ncbi:MAG: ACT domain-containing protein [Verrucomicrobiae bacterium]|nr:ACT domain-containing protein [Verrucomicrobiae bacterium]